VAAPRIGRLFNAISLGSNSDELFFGAILETKRHGDETRPSYKALAANASKGHNYAQAGNAMVVKFATKLRPAVRCESHNNPTIF
jgi:hypothetical protein